MKACVVDCAAPSRAVGIGNFLLSSGEAGGSLVVDIHQVKNLSVCSFLLFVVFAARFSSRLTKAVRFNSQFATR